MMSYRQPVRSLCLDCATPFFPSRSLDDRGTRCERCLRNYRNQLQLLLEFSMRSRNNGRW